MHRTLIDIRCFPLLAPVVLVGDVVEVAVSGCVVLRVAAHP